jgi:hypothetical protein
VNTFVELLKESVIMRGILAVIVIGVSSYLVIVAFPVPEWYVALAGGIIGYFFGSRPDAAVQRAQEMAAAKKELEAYKEGG